MVDFKDYLRRGLLKKSEPDYRQVSQQINRAIRDMHTFALVADDDPEWAATIAYQSMLRVGRALLYSYGYLPADGQQHKTVVELTSEILGRKYELITLQFERFRKKRNVFFYDSYETGSKYEAKQAAEAACKLIEAVKENFTARDILLDLKID
jgi:hypothetical protein